MYQVEWEAAALEDLASVCLQHPSRWADINGAVDIIDYLLQRDPISRSRHIADELRRIDSLPLSAYFAIIGTIVTIASVRWSER
jgi:hypothetical protein